MTTAGLLLDCRNLHGEGITWDAATARAVWTDIEGQRAWWFDPATGDAGSTPLQERLCCIAPRARGGYIAGFASGFALLDRDFAQREHVERFEPELPGTRLNDGKTDRRGRFVAGGMDERTLAPISSVRRVAHDRSTATLVEGVACANSLCFSPDGRTMYFADSPAHLIEAFDYDPDHGTASGRRPFAKVPEPGVPDGSCVDAEGYLWNAVWQGQRVERWSPDGRLDRVVRVPVAKPTCCAFCGPALDLLLITTSRQGETADQLAAEPQAGGLFGLRPGVRGLLDAPFAG